MNPEAPKRGEPSPEPGLTIVQRCRSVVAHFLEELSKLDLSDKGEAGLRAQGLAQAREDEQIRRHNEEQRP